jgi:transcriptional regulator with XRE-family HTH domain
VKGVTVNPKVFRFALAKMGIPAIRVARLLGIHHSTLSYWENGHYPVPFEQRSKLSEILNVSVEELFSSEEPDGGLRLKGGQ